jgi:hypothetical protein
VTGALQAGISWRKTAAFGMLALLAGMALGILMLSQKIYLGPSLFRWTRFFYFALAVVPSAAVWIACWLRKPTGSRVWAVLLPFLYALFLCGYLALIGPAFPGDIQCGPAVVSGPGVHRECTCQWGGSSDMRLGRCSLDGLRFLPFAQVTWQTAGE